MLFRRAPMFLIAAGIANGSAASTTLVDRLKDYKLQGYWRAGLKLFDRAYGNGRVGRWQSFHFGVLIDMLGDAKQWGSIAHVWRTMKEHGDIAIDSNNANYLLHILRRTQEPTLMLDIASYMRSRKMELHPGSRDALIHVVAKLDNWVAALKLALELKKSPTDASDCLDLATASTADPPPPHVFRELTESDYYNVLASLRTRSSISAVAEVMKANSVPCDARVYALMIAATKRKEWRSGIELFDSIVSGRLPVHPTIEVYHAAIKLCVGVMQKSEMERILQLLLEAADSSGKPSELRPNARTLNLVAAAYKTFGRAHDVISVFKQLHDKYGVKGSGVSYGILIEAHSYLKQHNDVLRVNEEMKKEGIFGGIESTVSLINAWSSSAMRRSRTRRD